MTTRVAFNKVVNEMIERDAQYMERKITDVGYCENGESFFEWKFFGEVYRIWQGNDQIIRVENDAEHIEFYPKKTLRETIARIHEWFGVSKLAK